MLKRLFFSFTTVIFFLFAACGNSENESETPDADTNENQISYDTGVVESEIPKIDDDKEAADTETTDIDIDINVYDHPPYKNLPEKATTYQNGRDGVSSSEEGVSTAIDSNGFVYITGSTDGVIGEDGAFTFSDAFLIKTNSNGDIIWKNQFGTDASDEGKSVAVDSMDNIYIAGVTTQTKKNYTEIDEDSIFLIKISNDGNEYWTKYFPKKKYGELSSITVDTDDTILMIGSFQEDIALSRWNAKGENIWFKTWGTPNDDYGYDVMVFKNGEIAISGSTEGNLDGHINSGGECNCHVEMSRYVVCYTCKDSFVSKMNSDGELIWTTTLGNTNSDDKAYYINADNNGNILISGTTQKAFNGFKNQGGVCGSDRAGYQYAKIPCGDQFIANIDSSGKLLWISQWGREGSDVSGNVVSNSSGIIFTGGSTLISHNINGEELWRKDNESVQIKDLSLTNENTIITTGSIPSTRNGNFINKGFKMLDGMQIPILEKYTDIYLSVWSQNGDLEVSGLIDGNTSHDLAISLLIDSEGSLVTVGKTDSISKEETEIAKDDVFVTKRLPNGTEVWTNQLGSDENDNPTDAAIDSHGNIYVSGYTKGAFEGLKNNGEKNAFLLKWNNDGESIWSKQWGTESDENANGVAIDKNGDIFVTGNIDTNDDENELFLRKIAPDGSELWSVNWGTKSNNDSACSVAVNKDGNIAVTGTTFSNFEGTTNGGSGYSDIFVTIFSTDGKILKIFQWGDNTIQRVRNIKFNSHGDILLYGDTGLVDFNGFPTGISHLFLAKFSVEGKEIWLKTWDLNYVDGNHGIFIDEDDRIYVSGTTKDPVHRTPKAFLAAFDSDGTDLFAYTWGSKANDYGTGVAVNNNGTIYVSGYTNGVMKGATSFGGYDTFLTVLEID